MANNLTSDIYNNINATLVSLSANRDALLDQIKKMEVDLAAARSELEKVNQSLMLYRGGLNLVFNLDQSGHAIVENDGPPVMQMATTPPARATANTPPPLATQKVNGRPVETQVMPESFD